MEGGGTVSRERRCPTCGALVSADADWCSQCFTTLARAQGDPAAATHPAAAEPSVRTPSGPAPSSASAPAPATWPCAVCGTLNPIEDDACTVCGTSFAETMRRDERRPKVDPVTAFRWSLVYPGLGHAKLGRSADGLARGVLFGVLLTMAVVLGTSGVRSGIVAVIFWLFVVLALGVYLFTALEARRLADGGEPLIGARVFLWTTVGLIMVSLTVLAFSVMGSVRR
jgi:hypothetical protein